MKYFSMLFLTLISLNIFSFDPRTAHSMVQKGEAILIDVREMPELKEGMIDNAVWFPKSQMVSGSDVLSDFKAVIKNKKVFVYCESGKRAEVCKEILKKEGIDAESLGGFKNLKHVLPTKSLYQRINEPFSDSEAYNRPRK